MTNFLKPPQNSHHHHHQPLQQLSTPHPNITVTSTPCNPSAQSDSALLTPVAPHNVIDVTPPNPEGNNSSMQVDHPPIDGTPLMAM